MARSSYERRWATTWAASYKPQAMPRVVRLGRAANDNARKPGALTRLLVVGLVGAFVALVLANWRFI